MSRSGVSPLRVKRYTVSWRHRTLDQPDYPYAGSGACSGRTKREALRNHFSPWGVGGDTSGLYEIQAAFLRGEIEILSMERSCS